MANRNQFKMSIAERSVRSFSESFKQAKVREIETGKSRVCDVSKEYEVSSTSIYRWLKQYGTMKKKPERMIIESESDTKKILELKMHVADLERTIGQKQVQLDFKDRMIDMAEEHYGIDIKKNFSTQPSTSAGKSGKS